ncbi:MAG: N-acetylmannosamine-6-phosphate 2-epimerase [Aphanocapsa lilacina HA4352-LM1]|jgi:N-acylglucosamine-6-phosphate 2-epimerase|nr:N-acetylmannosamine-6-phosphate 2-epimerase [Aphanocapsa lilacina HA4352-LM1]
MKDLSALRGLIVSCQAPEGSPLRDPTIIAAMAATAVLNGAVAVRIESPEHIRAVRARVDVPIVGLWKRPDADSPVYITPTFGDAAAVAQSGADIVAIDATGRTRPGGESLAELIGRIHRELDRPVLADVATVAEGEAAARLGADIVVTTLCGYTEATLGTPLPALDLLGALAGRLTVPVWCEGGVQSPEQVALAFARGARAVVVGTALTGLDARVRAFAERAVSPAMQTNPGTAFHNRANPSL